MARARPAGVVAMAVAFVLLTAMPTWPGNTVDTSGGTFRVHVPIDVFADDPSLADKWEKAIRDYWNNPPGLKRSWKYCGQKVEFVPDIQVFPRGSKGRPDTHDIYVKLVAPGVDFTSNVRRRTRTFDPSQNSTGVWASNEDDATIAHEFGHFLGLPDEYEVVSQNPRRTRPRPGFEDSLMAEHDGALNQDHIDQALMNNKAECERWSGVWVDRHTVSAVGVVSRAEGTFELTVAPNGSVSGKGSITQTTEGGSADFTVKLTGVREEDALRLTVVGPGGRAELVASIHGTTAEGDYHAGSGGAFYDLTLTLECTSCKTADG